MKIVLGKLASVEIEPQAQYPAIGCRHVGHAHPAAREFTDLVVTDGAATSCDHFGHPSLELRGGQRCPCGRCAVCTHQRLEPRTGHEELRDLGELRSKGVVAADQPITSVVNGQADTDVIKFADARRARPSPQRAQPNQEKPHGTKHRKCQRCTDHHTREAHHDLKVIQAQQRCGGKDQREQPARQRRGARSETGLSGLGGFDRGRHANSLGGNNIRSIAEITRADSPGLANPARRPAFSNSRVAPRRSRPSARARARRRSDVGFHLVTVLFQPGPPRLRLGAAHQHRHHGACVVERDVATGDR